MNLRENSVCSAVVPPLSVWLVASLGWSCASEPPLERAVDEGDGGTIRTQPETSTGSEAASSSSRLARALGGGEWDSLEVVTVFQSPSDMFCDRGQCNAGIPSDLEFNPLRPEELWVVFRQPYQGQPCRQQGDSSGCSLLRGAVAIISGATGEQPSAQVLEDGNSWHFMRLVTALAFASDGTFATVGEDRTSNYHDSPIDYTGPTLWSSDPDVFAVDFNRNGSHLDMLHATPYGMGIAHQRDHVFFAFNGDLGAIDAYDFKEPHEPGGEDHSDGELYRYVEGQLAREEGVPSHMQFLQGGTTLLIADTGHGRVVALDTASGRLGERLQTPDEQLADPRRIDEAQLEVVVEAGVMQSPSGLVIGEDSFVVGDAATGTLHEFAFDGTPGVTLETSFPPGALGGLELGPDGHLYVTRLDDGRVLRLVPDER